MLIFGYPHFLMTFYVPFDSINKGIYFLNSHTLNIQDLTQIFFLHFILLAFIWHPLNFDNQIKVRFELAEVVN